MSFYGDASESDFWREFTNNFATDLAPIISLFGEQVTKQYLTESTTFLDSLIFAIAPLGVITAVVSVIRVRGTPFLRSLIGRAREPHGSAELELCSSTSQDVSEMWSNGGVCRVLGRPQILEFIYKEPTSLNDYTTTFNKPLRGRKNHTINYPTCGIYLVQDVLADLDEPSAINHGWTEITPTHSWPRRLLRQCQNLHIWLKKRQNLLRREKVEFHAPGHKMSVPQALGHIMTDPQELSTIAHEEGRLKVDTESGPSRRRAFAPYPNLSLNLGSRGSFRRASQLKWSGLAACLIQASFFGYVTWATWYSRDFRNGANATEPLPFFVLCTCGTAMLTIGMTVSAILIDHNSAERLFIRDPSVTVGEDSRSHFFWLQPGDQRVGDQAFPAFGHNEKRDSYITSWKVAVEQDGLQWRVRFAILTSLMGWICQFVGLRGLHASVGLYHLGVTLVMSFLRAMLRSGSAQPPKKSQPLPALSTVPADHELDWQALEIGLMRWLPQQSSLDTPTSVDWSIHDEIDILSSKPSTLADKSDDGMHFNYFHAASDYSKIDWTSYAIMAS